jgi:hypothetical protein
MRAGRHIVWTALLPHIHPLCLGRRRRPSQVAFLEKLPGDWEPDALPRISYAYRHTRHVRLNFSQPSLRRM